MLHKLLPEKNALSLQSLKRQVGRHIHTVLSGASMFAVYTCTQQNPKSALLAAKLKIVEFANRLDPDEATNTEPPHLGLYSLPSGPVVQN